MVIEGDALEIDPLAHLTPPMPHAANLPYNVGTRSCCPLVDPRRKNMAAVLAKLTLMFQREVAERIVAKPRSSPMAVWLCWHSGGPMHGSC